MLDETVQSVVLAHVFEGIFLMPSGEHGGGGCGCDVAAEIGAEDGGLVAFPSRGRISRSHNFLPRRVPRSARGRVTVSPFWRVARKEDPQRINHQKGKLLEDQRTS